MIVPSTREKRISKKLCYENPVLFMQKTYGVSTMKVHSIDHVPIGVFIDVGFSRSGISPWKK